MAVDNSAVETLLVFGASGTLGRALVARARSQKSFAAVAACGFRSAPEGDFNFQFNALEKSELAALPDRLAKKNLRVAAIVNCIGGTRDQLLVQTSQEDWDRVIDLNLRSSFLIARVFLPVFTSQRRGHFLFLGSHAGVAGRAGQAGYAAAKAGLIGLAQTVAREYGRRQIQANVVLPGYIPQSPSVKTMPGEIQTHLQSETLLGSPSDPDEMAGFILHLLSMKKVSGQVFALDSRILPQ
jgi:NAD(P)-dependent dehydrogenase (short-subunit alcohol dehydrogenase family)